jgi:hypothetical protein
LLFFKQVVVNQGIPFQIRTERQPIYILDKETEKRVGEAIKNIESGNFVRIKGGDEKAINKFLGVDT